MAGTEGEPVPTALRVLIVGGGIGGLTAALAFRQQGHLVEIFEQSKFSREAGAAVHLASNSNGLLRRLGLRAEDIGGVECTDINEYFPDTGQLKSHIPVKDLGKNLWAHSWLLVHRAHLHTTLREMATGVEGQGTPARLHLGTRVSKIDSKNAAVTLYNGTVLHGDILIGADGVHAISRATIPGGDLEVFESGKSAFRFLLPVKTLAGDPDTANVAMPGTMSMWIDDDRRVIAYPCMDNTMMNFVCIHPSAESYVGSEKGWQQSGSKSRLLEVYRNFHPTVLTMFNEVEDIKTWELLDMEKMPCFVHERLAIMGDAAHPFLPHQGQGAGQAIEDAVALAALLPLGTSPDDIEDRLTLYNECRYERAHKIQHFTRLAGKDAAELASEGKHLNMMEYQAYNLGHDAWDFAKDKLRKALGAKNLEGRYRNPTGFGISPGPRLPLGLHPSHCKIQELRKATPQTSETIRVRFKTSRTFLESLLPPGLTFSSPGTLASASMSCTTLNGMTWLGGGGYSHCGLYIHGLEYTRKNGDKLYGTFIALLFENHADPIITGRDELGMPKLFCDIRASITPEQASVTLSWLGTNFGTIRISGLEEARPTSTAARLHDAEPKGSGPPVLPVEQGQLVHRYVPAVGQPGVADIDYMVFIPRREVNPLHPEPQASIATEASLAFDGGDWNTLPTLHYIAKTLAEMPIYDIEQAEVTKTNSVDDIGTAQRVE